MKPKIAITLGKNEKPSDNEYIEAVRQAGGNPVVLRPGDSVNGQNLGGLILAGGEDVEPEFYNETKEQFCDETDRKRDDFEFSILKKFLSEKKPVLAICRGIQVLNVALGGSLYQDIHHQLEEDVLDPHKTQEQLSREEKRALRHPVKIQTNCVLHPLFGDEIEVNSRHHQALKNVAESLRITAISSDGIVEAVESRNDPWVVGVQWHPEAHEVYSVFSPLFKGFVFECIERIANGSASAETGARP